MAANHDPTETWDPMVDYAMMSRNVRAFMSLYHCSKPVVCKVQGFCVAGRHGHGAVLRPAGDRRRRQDRLSARPGVGLADHIDVGLPARALSGPSGCSSPATALSGAEALEWGLAIEAPPPDQLDERVEALVGRIAQVPINQLQMMKLLVNQSLYQQGLHATQVIGTLLDGAARHTPEGYAFQGLAAAAGLPRGGPPAR